MTDKEYMDIIIKHKIDVPFHENFFCGEGMELAIGMWTDVYYELLSIIGDDYE